jgi:hypothetical protein
MTDCAARYAESVGAVHMHTSAKANRGLDEVFGSLAQSTFECRLPCSHVLPAVIPALVMSSNDWIYACGGGVWYLPGIIFLSLFLFP